MANLRLLYVTRHASCITWKTGGPMMPGAQIARTHLPYLPLAPYEATNDRHVFLCFVWSRGTRVVTTNTREQRKFYTTPTKLGPSPVKGANKPVFSSPQRSVLRILTSSNRASLRIGSNISLAIQRSDPSTTSGPVKANFLLRMFKFRRKGTSSSIYVIRLF